MSRSVKFSIRLPEEINTQLEAICRKRRGVTKTAIIEAAVKDFLSPSDSDKKEALIGRHLSRIERRLKAVERGNEILGEALGLFVRVWLTNTLELPEEQKEVAERAGGRRYSSFVKVLGERLQAGNCLFDEIPREVLIKADEFFDVEGEGTEED